MGAPLVKAEAMGVRRSGRWLIRDVDLAVHPGEIVTLIGPNGGGKSTAARALLGLIEMNAGSVVRNPGLRIGYVPQKVAVDRTLPMSVARLMQLTGRYPAADVEEAMRQVGVAHLADAQLDTLSGGEFQRALLARAIVRRPDLLVLDEPVQGVDFSGEIELYQLIADIRNRLGCGVLLISHDLHIVMAETDTVVCLNGHVCCAGAPRIVADNPEYQRMFGARGAQALAIYQHMHDHEHGPDGHIIPAPGEHRHSHEHDH